MAIVSELITKFRFDGSINPLNNFNKGLGLSSLKMFAFVGAISAVSIAFGKMLHDTLSESNALVQLSRTTGVAINDIQSLSYAASVSGSSINAMEDTIASLSKKIGDASLKGSSEFQRIGVAVRTSTGELRKADDVLLDVAKRFKALNLTMPQQQSLASSLGIDSSLVQLLSKSTDEIDRLRGRAEKFGLLSKKNADQIANYNEEISELKFRFLVFKQALAIQVLPSVLKLFDGLEVLGDGIKRVGGLFFDLSKDNKEVVIILGTMAGAFALISSPIAIATAGITALLLVFDDLLVAFRGGDSVIKKLVEPFFDLEKVLKSIVGYFKQINAPENQAKFYELRFGSPQKAKATSSTNNVNQNNTFNISSNDSQAVGNSVENSLQKQLENAQIQLSRGGI